MEALELGLEGTWRERERERERERGSWKLWIGGRRRCGWYGGCGGGGEVPMVEPSATGGSVLLGFESE